MADKLTDILALSRGIRKTFLSVSLAEYIRWLKAEEVVVEDWNRDEVEKRPGNANSLL